MEEDMLKPYLDYEAVWEQEYKTIQRKLEAKGTSTETKEGGEDDDSMCPSDPAALVSMATSGDEEKSVEELKTLVVAFTDEHNETLMTLPKRQCLLLLILSRPNYISCSVCVCD